MFFELKVHTIEGVKIIPSLRTESYFIHYFIRKLTNTILVFSIDVASFKIVVSECIDQVFNQVCVFIFQVMVVEVLKMRESYSCWVQTWSNDTIFESIAAYWQKIYLSINAEVQYLMEQWDFSVLEQVGENLSNFVFIFLERFLINAKIFDSGFRDSQANQM